MRITAKFVLVLVSVLALVPLAAEAQVNLTSPSDGEEISSPPVFAWSGVDYDLFYFVSVFYYDLGIVDGHFPIRFWWADTSLGMDSSWWDLLGFDTPCYWVVVGFDSATGALAVSDVWSFTVIEEIECDGDAVQACWAQVETDYWDCQGSCVGFDCPGLGCRAECGQIRYAQRVVCVTDASCENDPIYSGFPPRDTCIEGCYVDAVACYVANPVSCSSCQPTLSACLDACPLP